MNDRVGPERRPIDADLLGRLLDEHAPALALYAAQWTDAADDCVQEALVELASQPEVPTNLRAWLYQVVKRRALNAARGARRRRERETRVAIQRLSAAATTAAGRDEALAVVDAVNKLDADERELVIMRIWGGLSYEEIASALTSSTSNIHRRYQRTLEKLRSVLEPPCSTSSQPTSSKFRPS
jgi:RNA polymerase sigma-70 factor (ECF subfamily)